MRTYKYFDNVKKNAVFTEQACQFCGSKNDCLEGVYFEKNNIEFLHVDVMDGTFVPNLAYGPDFVKRLRKKGCVDLPASTGRTYRAPEGKEVVRVEIHDTDPNPNEQPLNIIPAATERYNLSVAESMKRKR